MTGSAQHHSTGPARTPPRTGAAIRMGLQILGFVAGLGLMVWCVSLALSPDNQRQFARLREASLGQIGSLVGLSILVVMISGTVFRQTLAPVRRLPMIDVQATNAIASLLALLPFKLSVVFRVVVHNRRDGVPLLTIGAWFAAVAAVMAATLTPILAFSLWRQRADAVWIGGSLAGVALSIGLLLTVARRLSRERAWQWFSGVWSRLPLPRPLRSPGLQERAHEGVRMLAHPGAVLTCAGLRMTDMLVQAARFMVAAAILGQPLQWDQAVIAGGTFFLIGAVAPSGQIGAREMGTAGALHAVLPQVDVDRFAIVVLLISAVETAVLLAGSMVGLAYLRPDRLLRLGHKPSRP